MNTCEEILNKNIPVGTLSKITVQCVIDTCHDFANQFKHWIKINGDNNPDCNTTVIAFDEEQGQCMGVCSSSGFWYEERECIPLNKVTHYHYKLSNPQ